MEHYNVFLPSYSVGEDCYKEIPWVTRRYGKKAVVIGGETAMEKSKEALLSGLAGSKIEILDFIWFGGNSTYGNAAKLSAEKAVIEADMIFAVGGGRAVDTCKVVAEKMDKPIFAFPTIASNCAGSTAIAVMYDDDDVFLDYFYLAAPPLHTFINTKIIAEAPDEFLWAGIGDALSKECEARFSSRDAELLHTPLMGIQLAGICTDPLVKYGAKAMVDCRENKTSVALEQVALDIIISTGIVSNMTTTEKDYYYNSSLAHCVYYGSTLVPEALKHRHGEVVAFGVLVLLTYEGLTEERNRIASFNKSIGLPVCLADIGLSTDDIATVSGKAVTVTEWAHAPAGVTREGFEKAIKDCDAYGASLK